MTFQSQSEESDSEYPTNYECNNQNSKSREQIKSRYGDLIDSLPIIIYIVEPQPPYAPIYVSKGIEMLGYTQDDWHDKTDLWISIIHEDDIERVLDLTREAIQNQTETDFEYRMYAKDRTIYWFHDKGHFKIGEDGELLSWDGFLLDITHRKSLEQNLIADEGMTSLGDSKIAKSILLVEDEEIVREMIRQVLLTEDYSVTTAADAIEALKICETVEKPFDLMITDVNMPEMNGRELAEKIQEQKSANHIIFISGYSDDKDFLRDVSDSEKHFLAKPFSPEVLTTKIKEVLNQK